DHPLRHLGAAGAVEEDRRPAAAGLQGRELLPQGGDVEHDQTPKGWGKEKAASVREPGSGGKAPRTGAADGRRTGTAYHWDSISIASWLRLSSHTDTAWPHSGQWIAP